MKKLISVLLITSMLCIACAPKQATTDTTTPQAIINTTTPLETQTTDVVESNNASASYDTNQNTKLIENKLIEFAKEKDYKIKAITEHATFENVVLAQQIYPKDGMSVAFFLFEDETSARINITTMTRVMAAKDVTLQFNSGLSDAGEKITVYDSENNVTTINYLENNLIFIYNIHDASKEEFDAFTKEFTGFVSSEILPLLNLAEYSSQSTESESAVNQNVDYDIEKNKEGFVQALTDFAEQNGLKLSSASNTSIPLFEKVVYSQQFYDDKNACDFFLFDTVESAKQSADECIADLKKSAEYIVLVEQMGETQMAVIHSASREKPIGFISQEKNLMSILTIVDANSYQALYKYLSEFAGQVAQPFLMASGTTYSAQVEKTINAMNELIIEGENDKVLSKTGMIGFSQKIPATALHYENKYPSLTTYVFESKANAQSYIKDAQSNLGAKLVNSDTVIKDGCEIYQSSPTECFIIYDEIVITIFSSEPTDYMASFIIALALMDSD